MRMFDFQAESGFGGGAGLAVMASGALELAVGDITCEVSDAIVNPVGGLVDLAVQRAAGPLLLEAFHRSVLARWGTRLASGQAVRTGGYGLPARHVIHCAPPVYHDGAERAVADLARCHIEALRLAREIGARSLSIPAIGTGAYRFPAREAAAIAVRTILDELVAYASPLVVRLVVTDETMLAIYQSAVRAARGPLDLSDW